METNQYLDFLKSKVNLTHSGGYKISIEDINPMLKPHQRDTVIWAIDGGCRAIFAAFGLGKTFMQLEIMRILLKINPAKYLIVAPLGVRQEFFNDAKKLNIPLRFIRSTSEIDEDSLYITNYESIREGKLDPSLFVGVSLDEASVLRSYGSKTYQEFLPMFSKSKFKFVCTATPSPNKYKELIHYAGFLGIMDTGQALTRFFKRDSTKANQLTIHPHKEREFWLWISSWAMFLQKPSDLGYSNEGYDLPELIVYKHCVDSPKSKTNYDREGQGTLIDNANLGLKEAATEKRNSLSVRVSKMLEIINASPKDHFLIWHDLERERQSIKKALPVVTDVYGSLDLEKREKRIMDFSNGNVQYLATKPVISGSGCNFQRYCHKAIFLGIGYKFNDFIQSVHRIYRFLQDKPCEIHVIYSSAEVEVLDILMKKWERHKELVKQMSEIIKKYGLSHMDMEKELHRSIGIERIEVNGELFTAVNNDCVNETTSMPENSVDMIVTSIPFANHYEYTPSYNDFGHTDDNDHFFKQMDFLTPQLLRILKHGRVAAIHVKDRILFGNVTGNGMPSVSPFHAETIFNFMKHGFIFFGMITVVTDVVRENNQTYRLGWTEQCKDGTKMGVGSPEYVLLFRKLPTDTTRAYADEPVVKSKDDYSRSRWQTDAHALWRSNGDRHLTPDELENMSIKDISAIFKKYSLDQIYSYEHHVKIGESLDAKGHLPSTFMALSPQSKDVNVWTDINRMRTLNASQTQKGKESHICPLQLDIVDRLINRYTNKDDVVFDPFGGIMTVPYCALKLGRKGRAVELNHQYFIDGIHYLKSAEEYISMPTLFDMEGIS